jgi:hypothetical protein
VVQRTEVPQCDIRSTLAARDDPFQRVERPWSGFRGILVHTCTGRPSGATQRIVQGSEETCGVARAPGKSAECPGVLQAWDVPEAPVRGLILMPGFVHRTSQEYGVDPCCLAREPVFPVHPRLCRHIGRKVTILLWISLKLAHPQFFELAG